MKSMLNHFAEEFSIQQERRIQDDEQRSIRNPVVFLFLGDCVKDALETIYHINEKKWQNSSGVVYFHAYQNSTINKQNIVSAKLPSSISDKKEIRKSLYDQFYQNKDLLIELNKSFRKVAQTISENGKLYTSRQKLNISVVTRIDDPANVVIQEFTLLLKTILMDSYKNVEVDLFGLIKEQNDGDQFAYTSSLGVSFLKELDTYQHDHYSFHQLLQVTEDELKLPVIQANAPLFDIAYLLSDKDEHGLLSQASYHDNYEMISQINLLKNQAVFADNNEHSEAYNNAQFRKNIQANTERNVYATAGLSKVKRPNKTIALHAAYHFTQQFHQSIKEAAHVAEERVLELFELTPSALGKLLSELVPSSEKIEDMNELLWVETSYSKLKKLSVKHAEHALYQGVSEDFFQTNIEKVAEARLEEINIESKLDWILYNQIIDQKEYGLYSAYRWTADDEDGFSVRTELRRMVIRYEKQFGELEGQLEQAYQQMVDTCQFKKVYLPFSDQKNLRAFIKFLFESIYQIKYEITQNKIITSYLKQMEQHLEKKHELLAQLVDNLHEVKSWLKEASSESLYQADDYIGKNVNEYYDGIISTISNRFEQKWGQGYYSEDRFIGNALSLLEQGKETFLERLLLVCQKEVLAQAEFNKTFEDELFERSNVKTSYDNRDVLSRDEIFKQLFRRLDEQSAVQIEVYNYTHKHRYEEKYFFGDYTSDFMKYALDREIQSRHFKVGCVHEKRTSGIEKLRIMGGFQINDLMYYRNHLKYYNLYLENGYVLHATPLFEEVGIKGGEEHASEKI